MVPNPGTADKPLHLLKELQRRNVFRVAIGYVVSCWLLVQVADLGLDLVGAPDWVLRTIVLVLGLGFPVVLFFSWAYEVTPEGIRKESEIDRSTSITHVTARKLDRAIIAVLAVALAYFIWESRSGPGDGPARTAGETAAVSEESAAPLSGGQPAAREASIAVLPFVNMSSDPEQEYFSDGLSEELLNRLAKVPQLQVAARTSSFSFKGQSVEIADLARRLHVAYVLEGSVRTSGDQVRITAQLIQASDGYHLWSEAYDRRLQDIFAVQDEIAARITTALLPRIMEFGGEAPSVAAAPADRYTPPAEVYQRYLLARNHFNKQTSDGREKALKIMEPLVREHPDYAEAQAFYALVVFSSSRRTEGDIPWITAEARSRRALERALALDPGLAEAYLVEGRLAERIRDMDTALAAYQKAVEMNPSYSDAYVALAEAAMMAHQPERAWEALDRARSLDPVSPYMLWTVAHLGTHFDRPQMAAEAMAVLEEISPEKASRDRARLDFDLDKYAEGIVQLEKHRDRFPNTAGIDNELMYRYASIGLTEKATGISDGFEIVAAVLAGDRERALELAEERAADRTDPHDRADVFWISHFLLGDYDEALTILTDLWYGYAEQTMGPRMDWFDCMAFAELLVRAGRADEAAPVIDILRRENAYDIHEEGNRQVDAQLLAMEGRADEGMRMAQDLADEGHFPSWFGIPYPSALALRAHPDFPKLEEKFEAWQAGQRARYEELKAAETP